MNDWKPFVWNESGVCINPLKLDLSSGRLAFIIHTASDNDPEFAVWGTGHRIGITGLTDGSGFRTAPVMRDATDMWASVQEALNDAITHCRGKLDEMIERFPNKKALTKDIAKLIDKIDQARENQFEGMLSQEPETTKPMTETKPAEKTPEKPVIIKRSVKHTYTRDERDALHVDLLNALATKDSEEEQFESIKATYKAKVTEAESRVCTVSACLRAGFEMRTKECRVEFLPELRKKKIFVLETDELVATEDMTPDDFQQELIAAERHFESRTEIELFPRTGQDNGILIVGRLNGRWFSALRVKVGQAELQERLDSEQKSFKQRWDAIQVAVKRLNEWAKIQLKAAAEWFKDPVARAIEPHRDREE